MGKGTLFLLTIIFLLAKTVNAAAPLQAFPSQAISIALIALSVSLDVVAVGYIISKLLPEIGIEKWLTSEYWEIAKSAMLIVGIYSAVVFISNISGALITPPSGACGGNTNPNLNYALANEACGYLSQVSGYLSQTYNYLFSLSMSLGALNSTVIESYIPIPAIIVGFRFGFNMHPYQNDLLESGGGQFESMLNDAIEYVALPVSLLVEAQLALMQFIFTLGLVVLIPLGIMLRAMPFVRGIGGTLVGLGIGISLIYPSVLILLNYPVTNALAGTTSAPQNAINPSCGFFSLICGALNFIVGTVLSGISGTSSAIQSIYTIIPALNGITNNVTYLLLQFFLFILDLAIVFSLSDGIARMLGGSIDLEITDTLKLT